MTDPSESPAVPPEPDGGNPRLGLVIAGSVLLLVGLGGGVLANWWAHSHAPPTGQMIGPLWVGPTFGIFAWAVVGLGLVATVFGVGLLLLARSTPKGPVHLPGVPY